MRHGELLTSCRPLRQYRAPECSRQESTSRGQLEGSLLAELVLENWVGRARRQNDSPEGGLRTITLWLRFRQGRIIVGRTDRQFFRRRKPAEHQRAAVHSKPIALRRETS